MLGQFPVIVNLELVEHVFAPRKHAATLYALLAPGGMAITSTLYQCYRKDLALALSGQMANHFSGL